MDNINDAKVKGNLVHLRGECYVLPPLPIVKMAQVSRLLQGGDVTSESDYVECLVDAVWWSLRRNYPEMLRDFVADNMDTLNFKYILQSFMVVNGFMDAVAGEAQAS